MTATGDKSKKMAMLCCIFGDMFGAYFGILYALTTGLGCIGWIIDLIKIVNRTLEDNAGAPLRK